MIRVAVADDDEQVCRYVRRLLGREADIDVVGHALTGDEAIALVQEHRPDVLVLDVRMPGSDGLVALARLAQDERAPAALVLTNFNDARVVQRVLELGATGVLLKSASPGELVGAVRLVAAGHRVIGAGLTFAWQPEAADDPDLAGLTSREVDVLRLLGEGLSNKGIAAQLALREATVKGHVSTLMAKLGRDSRLQLGLLAQRLK